LSVSSYSLPIVGYHDRPVAHTFFRQARETGHVALLLPGVGYTTHMPLLYYPARILLQLGADVLRVETMYARLSEYEALDPAERTRWVFADAAAACRAGLAQRTYRRITLVGKSLGTLAVGHLLATEPALPLRAEPTRLSSSQAQDEATAEIIWLTPLLWNETLREQIRQVKPRSLFASGSADPHYSADHLAALQGVTGGQAVVIENANHSLEIEGDVAQSLRALGQVVQAVQTFLAR